jgi:hypothetical protein
MTQLNIATQTKTSDGLRKGRNKTPADFMGGQPMGKEFDKFHKNVPDKVELMLVEEFPSDKNEVGWLSSISTIAFYKCSIDIDLAGDRLVVE